MHGLYKLVQGKNETCQVFATSKMRSGFPYMIREDDVERHLGDCLYYNMIKGLEDSIRYLYDDPKISYI